MRQPHRFTQLTRLTRRRPRRAAAPGFTIAELLIVVVITSILAAVASPSFVALAPSGAARVAL